MQLPHLVMLIEPGTAEDAHGAPVDDWDAATVTEKVPAWVQHTSSEKIIDGRKVIVTQTRCFLGPFAAVSARTRIVHDGVAWKPAGDPRPASTPFGVHHQVIDLTRAAAIPLGATQ